VRIAHVTATFPPYRGGTGNVAWHQARELARLGHEVHVFTCSAGGPSIAPTNVHVHRLRPRVRLGNAPVLPGLVAALRGFSVIHVHHPFFFGGEQAWLATRIHGTPYVVTYQHDVQLAAPLGWVPPLHWWLVGKRVVAGADTLLFSTRDYARSSRAAALADAAHTYELANGVDLARFHTGVAGGDVRRLHGIDPKQSLVLFVANLDRAHYFKGLAVLLHAVSWIAGGDLRVIVVGDGDLRRVYERQARQLGLVDRVLFVGSIADSSLPAYFAAADMLVLPSLTRSEAFGLVLLEAMASGTPVIASDLPGVRAVVRRCGGGLLVPPGRADALAAAIETLARDPALRADLAAHGRTVASSEYSWTVIGARLEAFYRDVLARRAAGSYVTRRRAPWQFLDRR